jgi:1-deoxy-D-xylulose-5-phosphate reductoisomerase
MKRVAVLGATGSIGLATIDVIHHLGPDWHIDIVSANQNGRQLLDLIEKNQPNLAILSGCDDLHEVAHFRNNCPAGTSVQTGPEALVAAATRPEIDVVVAAIVGRAGVESTLAALQAGKRVALANKETLVCAGPVVEELLARHVTSARLASSLGGPKALAGERLLPVDSEHSAIFQCLLAGPGRPEKLILTASGGPFRESTTEEMRDATPAQAMKHPTWKMGKKISIDSATMMNKALEIIEAKWLFDVPAGQLEVVVHPQSIIHSLVEFADGSIVAQMSPPDMRLPIQYALTYPDRRSCPSPRFDRTKVWDLTLQPVDCDRFPAIPLGFEVAAMGGTAGSVVNAANEMAVELFLEAQIRFTDIVPACRSVLENHTFESHPTLERLLKLDQWARAEVRRWSCRTVG